MVYINLAGIGHHNCPSQIISHSNKECWLFIFAGAQNSNFYGIATIHVGLLWAYLYADLYKAHFTIAQKRTGTCMATESLSHAT